MLTFLLPKHLFWPSSLVFPGKASVKVRADYNKEARFFKDRAGSAFFPRRLFVFLFLLSGLCSNISGLFAQPLPRELPVLLSVKTLKQNEKQYDGSRVVVSGRIESLLFQQGRMGSPYLKIALVENASSGNIALQVLEVISLDFPKARVGDKVLVQGDYHISGRKVGRRFDHFIDAEVIVLDE